MGPILFETPARFLAAEAAQTITRYGAILKDNATGQIVGHLQQTGGWSGLLGQGPQLASRVGEGFLNPFGSVIGAVGAVDGMIQDRKILAGIQQLQASIGGLKMLNIATLATSVIGIGVTVASTAVMLSRIDGVSRHLDGIEARLADLPREVEMDRIRAKMTTLGTQMKRFEERDSRSDKLRLVARIEEESHELFEQFAQSLRRIGRWSQVDASLLVSLLHGLLLSNQIGTRSLLVADELAAANLRAKDQADTFREIAWDWPADRIDWLAGLDATQKQALVDFLSESLAQQTGQVSLFQSLLQKGAKGSDYVEEAAAETEEPFLILPAQPAQS